jgi:2-amino-4-hydroxy-6-hydroxymethyldihydropteridine diphosphokinase
MIYIGLGANLSSVVYGAPKYTLSVALQRLRERGVAIAAQSRWYRTAPVPASDQPWFVNGVAAVATLLAPPELLALMLQIERELGRERRARWDARVIDLDLLAYHDLVIAPAGDPTQLELPHSRLQERAFVLRPLAELAPDWRHPVTGRTIHELLAALGSDQVAELLEPD